MYCNGLHVLRYTLISRRGKKKSCTVTVSKYESLIGGYKALLMKCCHCMAVESMMSTKVFHDHNYLLKIICCCNYYLVATEFEPRTR